MSFHLLAEAIVTQCRADTGSGGLFNASSTALITGFYTMQAPQASAAFPYSVLLPIGNGDSKVFDTTHYAVSHQLQISTWTKIERGLSYGQAIVNRIRYLLDRWTPTVSGYTVSHMMRDNGTILADDNTYHWVEEYSVTLST